MGCEAYLPCLTPLPNQFSGRSFAGRVVFEGFGGGDAVDSSRNLVTQMN